MTIKTVTDDRPSLSGPLALVLAIIQAGIKDAMKGQASAQEWLKSRDFDHWCHWANLNPDYLRGKLAPLLPKSRTVQPSTKRLSLSPADIEQIRAMRANKQPWRVISETMGGVSPQYLYWLVRSYGINPGTMEPEKEMIP